MFYDHALLTDPKYGVSTVWLVATLGAKNGASTRRVSRKAILNVDVHKACDAIAEPVVPLALRLSSNLLYGVSKVYNQQCGYVLSDCQSTQQNMMALFKSLKSDELYVVGGKMRPEQLMIPDDPAFILDAALPTLPLDFDLLTASAGTPKKNASQHSTQSFMSIGDSRRGSSQSSGDLSGGDFALDIPSSLGSYHLPAHDVYGSGSVQKGGTDRLQRSFHEEELDLWQDNPGFTFDADGNMVDTEMGGLDTGMDMEIVQPMGDDDVPMMMGALIDPVGGVLDQQGLDIHFNDDGIVMSDIPAHGPARRITSSSVATSETAAEAPQTRTRRVREKALINIDRDTCLSRHLVGSWQEDYMERQDEARAHRLGYVKVAQARKNAAHLVLEMGLGGVGKSLDAHGQFVSPLADLFSGAAILERITGRRFDEHNHHRSQHGTKRRAEADPTETSMSTPKRARLEDAEQGLGPLPMDDDGLLMPLDDSIEQAREGQMALPEHPSSALSALPWNVSASLGSHQRMSSARHRVSGALGFSGTGLPRRRGVEASPLLGRGSNLPGELDRFDRLMSEEVDVARGRAHDISADLSARNHFDDMGADFDVSGSSPQRQGHFSIGASPEDKSSQALREALDREGARFFEYVRNTIEEKGADPLGDAEGEEELRHESQSVTFAELFDPKSHAAFVAAQAFYHVLSLTTQGRLRVHQEIEAGEDGLVPGTITIAVVSWGQRGRVADSSTGPTSGAARNLEMGHFKNREFA